MGRKLKKPGPQKKLMGKDFLQNNGIFQLFASGCATRSIFAAKTKLDESR